MGAVLVPLALACLSAGGAVADRCTKKISKYFSDDDEHYFACPRPGNPRHFTECCGPSSNQRCCAPWTSHQEINFTDFPLESPGRENVDNFVGIIITVVILVVSVVLICCCCTPCCLLAKQRRNRGMVRLQHCIYGIIKKIGSKCLRKRKL
jgi:hypothetical protein